MTNLQPNDIITIYFYFTMNKKKPDLTEVDEYISKLKKKKPNRLLQGMAILGIVGATAIGTKTILDSPTIAETSESDSNHSSASPLSPLQQQLYQQDLKESDARKKIRAKKVAERSSEAAKFKEKLATAINSDTKIDAVKTIFDSEYFFEGVDDAVIAKANTVLTQKLSSIDSYIPGKPDIQIAEEIADRLTPHEAYTRTRSIASESLALNIQDDSQNCVAQTKIITMGILKLFPDMIDKLYWQKFDGHQQVVAKIDQQLYVVKPKYEGGTTPLKDDQRSNSKNYALIPFTYILRSYAGIDVPKIDVSMANPEQRVKLPKIPTATDQLFDEDINFNRTLDTFATANDAYADETTGMSALIDADLSKVVSQNSDLMKLNDEALLKQLYKEKEGYVDMSQVAKIEPDILKRVIEIVNKEQITDIFFGDSMHLSKQCVDLLSSISTQTTIVVAAEDKINSYLLKKVGERTVKSNIRLILPRPYLSNEEMNNLNAAGKQISVIITGITSTNTQIYFDFIENLIKSPLLTTAQRYSIIDTDSDHLQFNDPERFISLCTQSWMSSYERQTPKQSLYALEANLKIIQAAKKMGKQIKLKNGKRYSSAMRTSIQNYIKDHPKSKNKVEELLKKYDFTL